MARTQGIGSFVTLEFGDPGVEISEPRLRRWLPREGEPEMFMERSVHVHGEWHLWIYCCLWSLSIEGRELAHCESDYITIARALGVLNRQALATVEADVDGGSTFSFDLTRGTPERRRGRRDCPPCHIGGESFARPSPPEAHHDAAAAQVTRPPP